MYLFYITPYCYHILAIFESEFKFHPLLKGFIQIINFGRKVINRMTNYNQLFSNLRKHWWCTNLVCFPGRIKLESIILLWFRSQYLLFGDLELRKRNGHSKHELDKSLMCLDNLVWISSLFAISVGRYLSIPISVMFVKNIRRLLTDGRRLSKYSQVSKQPLSWNQQLGQTRLMAAFAKLETISGPQSFVLCQSFGRSYWPIGVMSHRQLSRLTDV